MAEADGKKSTVGVTEALVALLALHAMRTLDTVTVRPSGMSLQATEKGSVPLGGVHGTTLPASYAEMR